MSKTKYISSWPGKPCTVYPCPHECTCHMCHMCFYATTSAHVTCAFSNALPSSSCVLTDRCMTERTLHPVSLATLQAMACWLMWSTVHPIACGWSSTATPPEPIRASASRTQVSRVRDELGISWSEMQQCRLFLLFTVSAVVYSSMANEQKHRSLPLSLILFCAQTQPQKVISYFLSIHHKSPCNETVFIYLFYYELECLWIG